MTDFDQADLTFNQVKAKTAAARHDLDRILAIALPHAGGRVAQKIQELQAALADLDVERARTAPGWTPPTKETP